MKVTYSFECEEIKTCNGCPLCHYIDDGSMNDQDYCHATKSSVTDYCYNDTKPINCPLTVVK